uniref:Uncharacterized protein n=1 Tax=Chrysemys picta bellii TaxID=8478 RepID=A0A8C3IRD3_CHRPI
MDSNLERQEIKQGSSMHSPRVSKGGCRQNTLPSVSQPESSIWILKCQKEDSLSHKGCEGKVVGRLLCRRREEQSKLSHLFHFPGPLEVGPQLIFARSKYFSSRSRSSGTVVGQRKRKTVQAGPV